MITRLVKGGVSVLSPPNKLSYYKGLGYKEVDVAKVVEELEVETYNSYTVKELKSMCKARNLKGYSRLNEVDLVKLLSEG